MIIISFVNDDDGVIKIKKKDNLYHKPWIVHLEIPEGTQVLFFTASLKTKKTQTQTQTTNQK